jgi:hypothetical protein
MEVKMQEEKGRRNKCGEGGVRGGCEGDEVC